MRRSNKRDWYNGTQYIYAIQRSNGDIKIGYSNRLSHRLSSLKKQHGKIVILGIVLGDEAYEAQIHDLFCEFRLSTINPRHGGLQKTDWFKPAKELLMWIERNTQPYVPYAEQMKKKGFYKIANHIERRFNNSVT